MPYFKCQDCGFHPAIALSDADWPISCRCRTRHEWPNGTTELPPTDEQIAFQSKLPTVAPNIAAKPLTDAEIAELFPGEDPTLLGNRIKALTEAIGIPTCGGCDKRKTWINDAHSWLRSLTQ